MNHFQLFVNVRFVFISESKEDARASVVSEAPDHPPPVASGLDPNDGSDAIQSCPLPVTTPPPLPAFHPHAMMHTPPPVRTERRLPARSGSAASLFAPFATLTRKLGAKNRKTSRASCNPSPNPSFMASLGRKPKNRHPPEYYPPEFHPGDEIYSNTRLLHIPSVINFLID